MKLNKIIDIANKSYAYLLYKKVKSKSDNVESFISNINSLKVRRFLKNLVYDYYPIEDCSVIEQDMLFKEKIEMVKRMPSSFFDDRLNVLKIINMGSSLDYLNYLPANVINDKEFIVALLFKNKDSFPRLLKHLKDEILDDVEFLSYLTSFSSNIALSVIELKKDVRFNERFVEQLLKDDHNENDLYLIKENLLYYMTSVPGTNEKILDPYIIKETLKLLKTIKVSHTYSNKGFYPLLDYIAVFIEKDSSLLNEFKKEIVDDIEKYYEDMYVYYNFNLYHSHKKVYLVNDKNVEVIMDEAIKRNPLFFMFFNSEKLLNQDNIALIKNQTNEELKKFLVEHMISIMLSNVESLKKHGKKMEYLFNFDLIGDEKKYRLDNKPIKNLFYDWVVSLRSSEVPNGLTVDTFALKLFKFYEQGFGGFRFNNGKKEKNNWKNIFEHLDKEFNGNVKEFKKYIAKHSHVPDDVILELIKSTENKPGGEQFLKSILNEKEREGLLSNELFMKYSEMNIEGLSREEKIDRICKLEKNIAVANILLKNLDLFKSLRPENKKEFDIVLKALPSLNSDELNIIDKKFYANPDFVRIVIKEHFNIEFLKSKNFKENVDKSFFEDEDYFGYLLKKLYYIKSVKDIYGDYINNFRNFKFWKGHFKENFVAIPEVESEKKMNIEYFSFLTEENKIDILKEVNVTNNFLMTSFYNLKIIDDNFIIRNISAIMSNKEIIYNLHSLCVEEKKLGENVKKTVFMNMLNMKFSKNEKISDMNLNLMLKIFPISLKQDNDIMFKFLNLINENYKNDFSNVETSLFQLFMNNDFFKNTFEKIYGKVSVLEAISEDNLFFDKIVTKWEGLNMLKDLSKDINLNKTKVKKY